MAYLEHSATKAFEDTAQNSHMQERKRNIMDFWRQYKGVFEATNFGNNKGLQETEKWIQKTKFVDDPHELDSIIHREDFFRSEYAQTLLKHGVPLYREFMSKMEIASPYISKASKERWIERFYDEGNGFQAKKYWIQHQLPSYMDAWKKLAEQRTELTKDPGFKDIISLNSKFEILTDAKKESFLDMHFDVRKDLLSEAKALMTANKKNMLTVYATAEQKIRAAAAKGVLSQTKVGSWLHRIFKTKHSAKSIQKFLEGNGVKSFEGLVNNWTKVKTRFDSVTKRAKERGEETAARGLHILTGPQFLNLHYDERLKYVDELERRLTSAENMKDEKPIFVEIRHAMDVKDWDEAALLIAQAKADPEISGENRLRLESMEHYASKFAKKVASNESMNQVLHAKKRIDDILGDMQKSHSAIHPMVLRLMKGPHANRSIHQLRWMVYNNKWCRSHGFLDDDIARKGASKQNAENTRRRAKQGKDIGRHDVMTHGSDGVNLIRKNEFANHKATYRHINTEDTERLNENAEWLEHEQDPKVLYWTTACFCKGEEPETEIWHNELFTMLTELRGHARTLDSAEMIYKGPGTNNRLQKRGSAEHVSSKV